MSGAPSKSSWVLRLVLSAYPPRWRAEHAEEVAAVLADRGGRRVRSGDIGDLLVRGLLARLRVVPRLAPTSAVVAAAVAAWTASRLAGPWSSLHLLWGLALTGLTLIVAAVTAARVRRQAPPLTPDGPRWLRTACAVSATAVLTAPLVMSVYTVGDRVGWWNVTAISLAVRSTVLAAPPDAMLVVGLACAGLLVAVWLSRPRSWRGAALAVAAALALGSWFAQLRDLVPSPTSGISFGFTPFAEVLRPHGLYLHGLPGVLVLASLAITTACATIPSRRHRPPTAPVLPPDN